MEREQTGRVIRLDCFRGHEARMKGSLFSQLEAYWQALRDGDKVPLRSQITPRGIEDALPHAFILERVAPGLARFRLAGMHLNDLMGMEVRGMPFSAMFNASARTKLAEALESVFEGPSMSELTLSAEGGIAKPALSAQLLLLPLRSDLGDTTRALGCLVAEGKIGRAPRRFHIEHCNRRHLGASTSASKPIAPRVTAAAVPGFAEPRRSFTDKSYLRLVHSHDD